MITRILAVVLLLCAADVYAAPPAGESFDAAQALFYNGQYAEAAELSQTLSPEDGALAVYEFRTTAILFQLRRAIGEPSDKEKAFKACAPCPGLMSAFMQDFSTGRAAAREVLTQNPNDPVALFFLGKLDLNYVWLVLGTLGRKTGWNEYWEARHSLDSVLVLRPDYLRARVARAWIDYIVDTRMPWGTGWVLGGGNKKKALAVMRDAADTQDDFYASAEALFGLWDMQVREKNYKAALEPALRLAEMFPKNPEVARFIATREVMPRQAK
jgi:tetratricopeptide (TPR) repeat protein